MDSTQQLTPEEVAAQEVLRAQAAQQAIPTGQALPWFMSSLVREKEAIANKVDAPAQGEDQLLAELAGTEAWKYLKKFIVGRQVMFEELLKAKVAGSPFDMQEIGFRYVIMAQVQDILGEIINRVENFAKLVDKPQGDEPTAQVEKTDETE